MMTYPFVRSIKLFDYRIKLWQPRTVVARANVRSSDRSELLPSLRFSYILVAAGGWFYPLPVIILEHAFPPTGFLWLGSAVRYIWWQRWDNDNCQTGVAFPCSN